MLLSVRHETCYDYGAEPLAYMVQRLYLTPVDFMGQRSLSWEIIAPGIDGGLSYEDGFGNHVSLITARDVSSPLVIRANGLVEVTNQNGIVKDLRCPAPPTVFLRQTDFTQPDDAMIARVRDMAAHAKSPLEMVHQLMGTIHDKMQYQIGVTGSHTTGREAYAAGHGVCQDHAHVLIGMMRALKFPSRYVTGYLATDVGEIATASHAWAEVLIPDLGWVGFDAANGVCPTDHYVRVAGGIDAHDVTPVRGSRRGGADEKMKIEVSVEISQQ